MRKDYTREVALIQTRGQWAALLVFMVILIILPYALVQSSNMAWLSFVNFTMITIVAVLGLNVTTGMAGQVSMGHSAFVMVGGYITAILTTQFEWAFWAALPLASILTAVIGLLVGAPSARIKGFYLAVATFAFFFVAQFIIKNLDIAGGINGIIGIPAPWIGGLKINTDLEWYFLLLGVLIISCLLSSNLIRSRLGRAFMLVKNNDITASSMGIDVYLTKLSSFFIGALLGGLAGGLWVSYVTVVRADQFIIWDSIWYLGMIIIGGAGSTTGAILGVIALRLLSQVVHVVTTTGVFAAMSSSLSVTLNYILYGLVIVLFISLQPNGLLAMWNKIKLNYKRWPFGY
ncbi:MAG: branched-chain amino acid ABC transporter permease [Dehalococcoidales bacterium]|nr:branched-chain amino acid ABC transporter permease [Dehalococcoidales bacterium]